MVQEFESGGGGGGGGVKFVAAAICLEMRPPHRATIRRSKILQFGVTEEWPWKRAVFARRTQVRQQKEDACMQQQQQQGADLGVLFFLVVLD